MEAFANHDPKVSSETIGLMSAGFSPEEAECLLAIKRRYDDGRYEETPEALKRLEFAKWLVDHGQLSG